MHNTSNLLLIAPRGWGNRVPVSDIEVNAHVSSIMFFDILLLPLRHCCPNCYLCYFDALVVSARFVSKQCCMTCRGIFLNGVALFEEGQFKLHRAYL